MNIPRLVIAGTHSSAGKTSVTLALMAAFQKAGYRVRGFKVGPDYIDPGYHEAATGMPSHNLDTWLLSRETVGALFQHYSRHADIAIIEGVMGLFDGFSAKDDTASTAEVAKLLKAPVVLVLDGSRMARSAAAMVRGYATFDPEVKICGVILNKVGSEGHFKLLKEAIESSTNIPVLGGLLRNKNVQVPERHLGLTTASENPEVQKCVDVLSELAHKKEEGAGLDLERLFSFARSAPPFKEDTLLTEESREQKITIAVAKDRAFSFYYAANLDVLRALGAELVFFSPLEDAEAPPSAAALYFGGGFPEMVARELFENKPLLECLKRKIAAGFPVYAECGGLMYLSQSIETLDGKSFPMLGCIPASIMMTEKLQNFGYKEGIMVQETMLGEKGTPVRGHEFHYSRAQWLTGELPSPAYELVHRRSGEKQTEGFAGENLLASYLHVHFLSDIRLAKRFVHRAQMFSKQAIPVR